MGFGGSDLGVDWAQAVWFGSGVMDAWEGTLWGAVAGATVLAGVALGFIVWRVFVG